MKSGMVGIKCDGSNLFIYVYMYTIPQIPVYRYMCVHTHKHILLGTHTNIYISLYMFIHSTNSYPNAYFLVWHCFKHWQ